MRHLIVLASLAGCAGTALGPELVISDGAYGCGPVCASVEDDLAVIRANWDGRCGTLRMSALSRIVALGDAAVPTLARTLDSGDRAEAVSSARALVRLDHADLVQRWCDLETAHPYRDEMCRALE